MRLRRLFPALAVLAALGAPVPVLAQDAPPPVAVYYEFEVHPGDVAAINEGMNGWVERLEEDGETWTWNVYQSISGPPRFTLMSPYHTFADFDRDPLASPERQAENEEFFQDTFYPYIDNPSATFMVHRDDVSIAAAYEEEPAYWQVMEWEVQNSTMAYVAITNAMMKVKEAFASVNEMAVAAGEEPGTYHVFDVLTGDGPNRMMIAFPFDEMADLDAGGPLDFFNALVAEHGHEDAVMIEEVFQKYTVMRRNHFWAHRPDVSYAPDGM